MSELFYAFLLAGCIGTLVTWAFLRVVFWLFKRVDTRRALAQHDRATSCNHGRRKWSSIKCEECAAEFKAEAEREQLARPPTATEIKARHEERFRGIFPRGEQAGLRSAPEGLWKGTEEQRLQMEKLKADWEHKNHPHRMVVPIRLCNRIDSINVEFDHEDFGKMVVEVQAVTDLIPAAVPERRFVYRARLVGHLGGLMMTRYVDVDHLWALSQPVSIAEARWAMLRIKMNEIGAELIRISGR